MIINLTVSVGRNEHGKDIYYHIRCTAEGVPDDKDSMQGALMMLWTRLTAGKKSYARQEPYLSIDRDFSTSKVNLLGYFRLTTTNEPGELIKLSRAYDGDGEVSLTPFGLPSNGSGTS